MVTPDAHKIQKLRDAWEVAVRKDRPKDALAALEGLELLEPHDARWPHRKGDVLRRLGKANEAEESFVRAVRCYVAQGFLTRGVALAKAVVDHNPARTDVLEALEQAPAKKLRDEVRPPRGSPLEPRMPPPPRLPSGTMQAVRGRPIAMPPTRPEPMNVAAVPTPVVAVPTPEAAVPTPPPRVAPIPREEPMEFPKMSRVLAEAPARPRQGDADGDDERERPSLVAGVRADSISVVSTAMGLESAKDAADDEVRFVDVPDVFAVEVDVSELEAAKPRDSSPELEVGGFEDEEAPTALRLTLMSAASLFVDVPKAAMSEMVAAATLVDLPNGARIYRAGERADGLYVIVEGRVDVMVPDAKKKLIVSEGSVFGEDALLDGAMRGATTRVNGRMLALRIPKEALDGIVQRHAALGDVLFDVLVRRLITMALQTSMLFAAFDVPVRKELARLFEVRRAAAGVVIKQRGKRSDGLYLPLAGEIELDDGAKMTTIPLGTMFGHTSLLTDAPEQRTVRTRRESVVLRLPASRFLAFAARFPAALRYLAEVAQSPDAL